jgi:hypothetical protein
MVHICKSLVARQALWELPLEITVYQTLLVRLDVLFQRISET